MVDAWYLAFSDSDTGEVYRSARHHMKVSPYFPTISDIEKNRRFSFIYDDIPAITTEQPISIDGIRFFEELSGLSLEDDDIKRLGDGNY